jgi:hypothetical protein
VKYSCADGDKGDNKEHQDFFTKWCDIFKREDLTQAITFVSRSERIPVGDFLYPETNFCNKINNHPIILSPDSLANAVTIGELQTLLKLGKAVSNNCMICNSSPWISVSNVCKMRI